MADVFIENVKTLSANGELSLESHSLELPSFLSCTELQMGQISVQFAVVMLESGD